MVLDNVPPSPQCVGREFVRQYYTLMHQAPDHLHRFYNNQSSFVHGGLDAPNREAHIVVGQKAIHMKIQQLNFRDCHAKITQVDSQATLGGGVVVQVTGELSNSGQPMRRFTQTFVLAAQAPKKYYVHNDIFRYQDEIITDEECEAETCSEPEEEVNQECAVISEVPQQQPPQVIPFYNATAPLQPGVQAVSHITAQQPQHVLPPQPVCQVNGGIHPEDINIISAPVQSPVMAAPPNLPSAPIPVMHSNCVVPSGSPPPVVEENNLIDQVEEARPAVFAEIPEPEVEGQEFAAEPVSASNEPKTYANLFKSTAASHSPPAVVGNQVAAQQVQPVQQQPAQVSPTQVPVAPQAYQPKSVSPTFNQPGRGMNRNNRNGGPQNARTRRDSSRMSAGRNEDVGGDDRRKSQSGGISDSNQLFLGNLPHTATEDELKEVFSDFGTIVDLRVHSKPPNKNGMPGGRSPPNCGFITFETLQGVQNCLAARPIYFPKGKENGTPLNVEEKKTKDRPSYGGRPNNDNRSRDRDNAAPRRGPSGPNRNGSNGNGNSGAPQNRPSYNNGNGPANRGTNSSNNNTVYNNRR